MPLDDPTLLAPALRHAASETRHPLPRPAWVILVTVLLAALLPVRGGTAAAAAEPHNDPLQVRITQLTPAVLKPTGDLQIAGTVTNTTDETWSSINLHALTSPAPITDVAALTVAADTPIDAPLGQRITDPGTFDTIESLSPGQSLPYRMTVPRGLLGIADVPGVYWIGVHALGDSSTPRDKTADGRSRTFVPLVEAPGRRPVAASLVVPLDAGVNRNADGQVLDTGRWGTDLAPGGRLQSLLDLDSPSITVTWLVDAAVLEAVEQLAKGNPVDSHAPEVTPPPPASENPEPAPTRSPTASRSEARTGSATRTDVDDETRRLAADWLASMTEVLGRSEVLAVPYGDVDLSAAVAHRSPLVEPARDRALATLERFDITATPAAGPSSGYLRPGAIGVLGEDALTLLSDVQAPASMTSSVARLAGQTVLFSSGGIRSGGPDPATSHEAEPLAQRVLAEAALRRQSGDRSPLVVVLPDRWHARNSAVLAVGLPQPWLLWQSVRATAQSSATPLTRAQFDYPPAQAERELPASNFTSARQALAQSRLLARVIDGRNTTVTDTERIVLPQLGSSHRERPLVARRRTEAARAHVRDLLNLISVQAPDQVILSSDNGQFSTTVSNGLDIPVQVRLRATADETLTLSEPDTLHIPAGERRTVRIEASASRIGVQDVALDVTDVRGTPIGVGTTFPVRAAKVSWVVWWVIGGGALLFLGATGLRIRRRWLRSRSSHASVDAPVPNGPGEDEQESHA